MTGLDSSKPGIRLSRLASSSVEVNMATLVLKSIVESDLPIPGADPWFANPEDPAITVMTDFRERHSVVVGEDQPIDEALEHMKHAGVRCAFVTSEAHRVVGLITAYDIMSEKPARFIQSIDGKRKDVEVHDIMAKLADWRTLDVKELERTSVAAIHHLFEQSRLTHIPVMESGPGESRRLRGLLSAANVRRLLSRAAAA
jgi:CBS domain-containing protein